MKSLQQLTRPNIWNLSPYSSARDEYSGKEATVFLDANENPYNSPLNRYPDPLQRELKRKISKIKGVPEECIFLGNGSDEAIDMVYRCFTEPGIDNVVAIDPTYGMYKVCADINGVEYRPVSLNSDYDICADEILARCDSNTKAVWICSPNNPTGNDLNHDEIRKIIGRADFFVVVDEAYSDFSTRKSFRYEVTHWPNLIVLNTMSKAWGCAAIRLGMAYAQPEVIRIFNKVKYPYNVNLLTQNQAANILDNSINVEGWVKTILLERNRMIEAVKMLPVCEEVYRTDANFFLARMTDAQSIYNYLTGKGIIVRNRSNVAMCGNCLRITVGKKSENNELLGALRTYGQ